MKFFLAALSALLAVASAVPIYDVLPVDKAGIIGRYGDVYNTMKYMGGDMMGVTGIYNPMYKWWAGLGGMDDVSMGMYGSYSPLYHHYGLMGIGNNWDLHHSTGLNWYPGMVGDIDMRGIMYPMMMDKMYYKCGWNTVDKMTCYHRYGIEGCHMMMMHKMMPNMMC